MYGVLLPGRDLLCLHAHIFRLVQDTFKKYLDTDTFLRKYLDTNTFKILSKKKYLDTESYI